MSMQVRIPLSEGVVRAEWWHRASDGRLQCDLCPRGCKLRDGQQGFCSVRKAQHGQMVMTSYGLAAACHVDPIEKKPLYHFYPGSRVLSIGTAGCNLGCKHCQNWSMTHARGMRLNSEWQSPDQLAASAEASHCRSVAFTYNDPIVFAEYAIDCAKEAHARGLRTVAVSNGYISPAARRDFFAHVDAVNIDLKAFSDRFYRKQCLAELAPVLDTLRWIANETDVWLEVTTLVIPGYNDSPAEIEALVVWIAKNLGYEVPLHLTRFFPAYRLMDASPTPPETLRRARRQARAAGLKHVYTGNVWDTEGQPSYCHECGATLIGRQGYVVRSWNLGADGACGECGARLVGHFDEMPGDWARHPVALA